MVASACITDATCCYLPVCLPACLCAGNTLRQLVFDCIVDGSLLPPPSGTPPSRPSAARQLLATTLSFATSGLVHECIFW
jgi:hypothetical protein